MSSVAGIVNKIYKTGINIEDLVNYFYQIAKKREKCFAVSSIISNFAAAK
jgi:hypothetical protein